MGRPMSLLSAELELEINAVLLFRRDLKDSSAACLSAFCCLKILSTEEFRV
jgi:hypothetical protein